MHIFLSVCAGALILTHLLSVALAAWRIGRYPDISSKPLPGARPPVTIIVPLRGIENFTTLTIARAFRLDWPSYELIFCVADPGDAVIDEVRSAIATHPHIDASLLVGEDRISANPKLNNCAKGWSAARNDWVILADSNVLMPPDYVETLLSSWRADSGLVCSPPIGSRPGDIWAEVECAFLNTFQGRYQYAAESCGQGFAQGKTMLWKKSLLDQHGGLEALGTEIAEDAAATKLVRACGRRVHLSSSPFEQPLGRRTFSEIWHRQTRWAFLRRVTFPQFFAPEIFVGIVAPLCFSLAACWSGGAGPVALAATAFIIPCVIYLPELALARAKGWHLSHLSLPAMVLRDLLLPVIWVKSWTGASVSWRGNVLTVGARESTLSRS